MKKNKILLTVFSAAFLVLLIIIAFFDDTDKQIMPVSFTVDCGVATEKITCFENDNGNCYAFLPAFCEMSDVSVVLSTDTEIKIANKKIYNNMSCSSFKFNEEYRFIIKHSNKQIEKTLTFLKAKNIPCMYIDTQSKSMEYIHTEKNNSEKGKIRTYTADGKLDFIGDISSINGRGNTTWYADNKKPYSLELSKSADLFSMGEGKNWILLANATDDSHIRNKLAFDFANDVGLSYTTDSNWVDLYLNGEYAGLYLLCEKNETAKNRVDISDDGFLVSLELEQRLIEQKRDYIKTKSNMSFYVRSPDVLNDRTKEKIAQKMQAVENAVLSADGIDKESQLHWRELIDLDSWVRKYLVDEILGNFDGGYISHYLYADGNSKIYAGPVWDYDISLGNSKIKSYSIKNPNAFVFKRYLNVNAEKNNKVLEALCEKEEFLLYAKRLFKEEFFLLTDSYLKEKIPKYAEFIRQSSNMNAIRWSDKNFSLDAEVAAVSKYLDEHTEFLHSVWIEGTQVCQVSFVELDNDLFYTVKSGGTLSQLPQVEDNEYFVFKGFYYSDTDKPFDITKPIFEDTEIYAKWEQRPQNNIKRIIKYSPIAIIAVLFIVIFIIDIKRNKWKR